MVNKIRQTLPTSKIISSNTLQALFNPLSGLLHLGQGLNLDLKKVNVIEQGSDKQSRIGPTSLVDSPDLFHTG
ncbi:hypothetical protein M5K25_022125 [Dendrobium thyrsiflorum]|uniref:Uncharacterized protein n=1 Tax=Dendrobium thyrsiflorum TaxID=117978 RepID=A0ABD0U5K1_DENTH